MPKDVPGHSLRKWPCLIWVQSPPHHRSMPTTPPLCSVTRLSLRSPGELWAGASPHQVPAVRSAAKHSSCWRCHRRQQGSLIKDTLTEGPLFPNVNPGTPQPFIWTCFSSFLKLSSLHNIATMSWKWVRPKYNSQKYQGQGTLFQYITYENGKGDGKDRNLKPVVPLPSPWAITLTMLWFALPR